MQTAMSQALPRLVTQLFAPFIGMSGEQFLTLHVTRENIVQNTIDQLANYDSRDLKKPLRVGLNFFVDSVFYIKFNVRSCDSGQISRGRSRGCRRSP